MIKATAYRIETNNPINNSFTCQIQIEGINKENEENIKSLMKNWNFLGFVYSILKVDTAHLILEKDVTNYTLLYKNIFSNEESWKDWVKSFPHSLEELKIVKPVRTPIKVPVKEEKKKADLTKKNKSNRCSYRSEWGHNKRTCPYIDKAYIQQEKIPSSNKIRKTSKKKAKNNKKNINKSVAKSKKFVNKTL
jgi:hypothetical protein